MVSNSGHTHEHEKGGNFDNLYDEIMMMFSGCGHDLQNYLTVIFFLLHILGPGIGGALSC